MPSTASIKANKQSTNNKKSGWKTTSDPNILQQGPKPVLGGKYVYKLNKDTGAIDVYNSTLTGDKLIFNVDSNGQVTKNLSEANKLTPEIITNLKANAQKDAKVAIIDNATQEQKDKLKDTKVYKDIDKQSNAAGSAENSEKAASEEGAESNASPASQDAKTSEVDINAVFNDAGVKSNKGWAKLLNYPVKMTGDRIRIQVCEYRKSGLQSPDGSLGLPSASERPTEVLSTIYLPVQTGLTDSMSVDWGNGELNPLTAAAAGLSYSTQAAAAAGGTPGQVAGTFLSGAAGAASKFKDAPEMRSFLINYFTQEAVGAQGLLSRTAGAAINNNLELLFNGPQLRSFTFTFRLTPRNSDETKMIKRIIRTFKIAMVPEASQSELYLLAPNVFQLAYMKESSKNITGFSESGLTLHPYLNKFKRCALKDFSVNYTPDGQYMTYAQDGSMTAYELSMTFCELDPVLANDYEDVLSENDAMGY